MVLITRLLCDFILSHCLPFFKQLLLNQLIRHSTYPDVSLHLLVDITFFGISLSKERWFYICRVTIFLTIPLTISVCYFIPYWESDAVEARVRTQFQSSTEIIAKIGLNIGLLGFNVTLKESPYTSFNEPLVYNEHFSWNWASLKHKPKLLEETGHLKYQYGQSASKGLPIPILWVLDYFTIDGEDYRFTRFYQHAGWYCHTLLWFSFGCWLLSSCLFCIVIEYGSLMMMVTGLCLIATNIIWAFHSNPIPLEIPFRSPNGKVNYLHPDYSWAYWINLTNGLFCIILGTLIYILDINYPDLTAQFFGIDIVQNYDQYFREIDEEKRRLQGKQEEMPSQETKRVSQDSKYVALRKKVSSNRLSKLHRLTLRDPFNGKPFVKACNNQIGNQESEPYYAVPKTITTPVQPRIVGSIAARKTVPAEQFSISNHQ
ncbi:dual oxidase maturation factor 1 [Tetranychus urticae]|uniref:dual oxidase maturation factor 1 n=1 Tax=Tetranychus urticae TaxID=32264 RepID=UPI00077BD320|nr:dual oxidase maturation factor 1 [Tetranychus urticae]